jgi:5-methylcytosine-specific restriction endonuclease McrA
LKGLEDYNAGKITHDQMLEITVRLGFTNVIDAFHNLQGIEVPRFYVDERRTVNGIQLTDELMNIVNAAQSSNLVYETEARWSLVETAWELGISPSLLLVKYDVAGQALFVMDKSLRRVDITSARDALNGYQKGKCFYCFSDVDLTSQTIHVDHVFPHMLKPIFRATKIDINLDGVWNLVLACQRCNLSKSDQRPHKKYIERLFTRNEFFISSHHPLRETLINQTGSTSKERQTFLSALFNELTTTGKIQNWVAPEEYLAVF